MPDRPLSGIRIIDFSRMLPGPYCSMVLADMGAEVIRVEDPSYPYASIPPFYKKGRYTESAFNNILMRNKKSITLNLAKPNSSQILYKLIQRADVVLESFRPGVTSKLKIDYNTLSTFKPELIYCSLTGYGQNGPYAKLPGHDLNYMAISGLLDLNQTRLSENEQFLPNSNHVIVPCVQTADVGGALYAVIAILGALFQRINPTRKNSYIKDEINEQNSEPGQSIDISMLDCAFAFNPMVAAYQFTENDKHENPLQGDFPYYAVYRTKDGQFLSVGNIEVKFWHQFCDGLNLGEIKDKQYARGREREEVFNKIQDVLLTKTQKEWVDHFRDLDTCIMPVHDFESACRDPQIQARKMLIDMEHGHLGTLKNIASPIKYSRTPLDTYNMAPVAGTHTDEILLSLGYSQKEIQDFHSEGLFR